MKLTITPHNANVPGLATKFYYFEANGKNMSGDNLVPGSAIRYKVLISTEYLQKISNQYEVPLVNVSEFAPYNTRDSWDLTRKEVISMNDKFEKYFAPTDDLKVLVQQ